MNKFACRYAVVRFMPYPESGEFANIGVIMAVPKLNKFLFRLEHTTARYTHFFHHLQATVVKGVIARLNDEFNALTERVNQKHMTALDAFEHIVKPRANVVQFSEQRTKLIFEDLTVELANLYADFVAHEFARKKTYEEELKAKIKHLLKDLHLEKQFAAYTFKLPNGYTTKFDLIQKDNDNPYKLIKPLFFDASDTNKLINHADSWLSKLKRLDQSKMLPKDLLFPIQHSEEQGDNLGVIDQITYEFKQFGNVIESENTQAIKKFAIQ